VNLKLFKLLLNIYGLKSTNVHLCTSCVLYCMLLL